jgi:hypothetical protein
MGGGTRTGPDLNEVCPSSAIRLHSKYGCVQNLPSACPLQIIRCVEQHQQLGGRCHGEDVVMFLGQTGAGKSVTVNYVAGKPIEMSITDCLECIHVVDELEGCHVSNEADSQTKYLAAHPDRDMGLFLCDTPGFDDTEGTVTDVVCAFPQTPLLVLYFPLDSLACSGECDCHHGGYPILQEHSPCAHRDVGHIRHKGHRGQASAQEHQPVCRCAPLLSLHC